MRPSTLTGCRPIDGSSKTYITPVVRFLTTLASCIRWRSPVDKVEPALSRLIYPRPSSISLRAVTRNDSQMLSAIGRISGGIIPGTPRTQTASRSKVIPHASSNEIPPSLGARALSDKRVPWHSGQTSLFRNFSTLFMPLSSVTLERAFSTVRTAL